MNEPKRARHTSMGTTMQRFSAADALFLYAEKPEAPMNIGSAQLVQIPDEYEGRFRDRFLALLKERSKEVPIMNWVVAEQPYNLDYPVWTDAGTLDWSYHYTAKKMPKGSTLDDVMRELEGIHAVPLDRSKPLFQYYVFDGLADNQAVIYAKLHHSCLDGQAGVQLMMLMYDLERTPRPPLTADQMKAHGLDKTPCHKPTLTTALIDAAFSTAEKPVYKQWPAARKTLDVLRHQYTQSRHNPAAEGTLFGAPRSILNSPITDKRAFAIGKISLTETKAVAKAMRATLNDVILSVTGGALRNYLKDEGELPDKSLVCAIPVAQSQKDSSLNNVAAMTVAWRTDESDPLRRIKKLHHTTTIGKRNSIELFGAIESGTGLKLPAYLAKPVMSSFMSKEVITTIPPLLSAILSNVPGAPMTLYMAGCELLATYPLSVITHGCAVNITVMSYRDDIDFGITTCPDVIKDADKLMRLILEEFEDTKAALAAEQEAAAAPKFDVIETEPAAAEADADEGEEQSAAVA